LHIWLKAKEKYVIINKELYLGFTEAEV